MIVAMLVLVSSTCTALITVADTSDPEFVLCPEDMTVNTGGPGCSPVVNYTEPIADDDCGITSLVRTAGLASGAAFPLGTTTITYLATDACGNTSTCTFDITIVDESLPSITCPLSLTVCAPAGSCTYTPTGLDPVYAIGCSGTTTLEHSVSGATTIGTTTGILTTALNLGVSTVTYTLTKNAGLPDEEITTCAFTVTVEDCTAPSITCPTNMNAVECGSENLAAWIASATATDDANCSAVTISQSILSTTNGCGNTVSYTYLFTATDIAGNSSIFAEVVLQLLLTSMEVLRQLVEPQNQLQLR